MRYIDYDTQIYQVQIEVPKEYRQYLIAKYYSFEELLEEIEDLNRKLKEMEDKYNDIITSE